jgi:two-component system sensor histidine kinase/response regulator
MKRKVLLVDDEKSFTNLLKMNLEQTGRYEVRAVNWGEDALPAAKEFKPDIMLLDIIMPRMPGGNVVALFEADPEMKDLPIVFLTAAIQRSTVAAHDGIICDHPCIAKPANLDEIIDAIEKNSAKAA